MRKYILIIIVFLASMLSAFSQTSSTPLDSMKMSFEQDAAKQRSDFAAYEAQALADYEQFVKSITNIWGGDTIINDTPKEWVEYDTDFCSRSIVNFEKGDILIEVAIDEDENSDISTINSRLAKTIERLLNSRGSSNPYKAANQSEPLTKTPILDDIVDFSMFDLDTVAVAVNNRPAPPKPTVKGKPLAVNQSQGNSNGTSVNNAKDKKSSDVSKSSLAEKRDNARKKAEERANTLKDKSNKSSLAQKIAQQINKKTSSIIGNDGKSRKVVQVQMSLVADNLSKNAYKYKDIVAEFSEKFQVEQPLIFAVMEVESAFNPEAKSWANAYGLMQLVPKYGGATAYQYVYKKSWIPEPAYLYNPRNNIELGTAYLRILMNTFSDVNDTHCQRLCVIAGYNTGPGNVCRAFDNTRNLSQKIFALINKYEYSQLYNHLIVNLPAQETRNYVKKVTEKREKYMKK